MCGYVHNNKYTHTHIHTKGKLFTSQDIPKLSERVASDSPMTSQLPPHTVTPGAAKTASGRSVALVVCSRTPDRVVSLRHKKRGAIVVTLVQVV